MFFRQVAPGFLEELDDDSVFLRFLQGGILELNIPQLISMLQGDAEALNRVSTSLRRAARGLLGDQNTPEARADVAARITNGIMESITYQEQDLKEGQNPGLRALPHLQTTLVNGLELLAGEGGPEPPEFGPQLKRWFVNCFGGFLVHLRDCFRGGLDDVKRLAAISIMRLVTGGLQLGPAAGMIAPMLQQAISSWIGSLCQTYDQGSTPLFGETGNTEAKGWMGHLTAEERKNWSRVIEQDAKRQAVSRPRPLSRSYLSGRPSAKRQRVNGAQRQPAQRFRLGERICSAIEAVNGRSATNTKEAKAIVSALEGEVFQSAFTNQLRNDLSRRVRVDPDFKNETETERFAATRQWMERGNDVNDHMDISQINDNQLD